MTARARKPLVAAGLVAVQLAGVLVFALLGEVASALVAALVLLLLLAELRRSLQPWLDERHVLAIVRASDGRMPLSDLEKSLEERAESAGVLSGDLLEDLQDAFARLVQKGRLRIDCGFVQTQ